MHIQIYEDEKIVEYWLTNAESQDTALQQYLHNEAQTWKAQKFKFIIFHSGKNDLLASTKALIIHNIDQMDKMEKPLEKGA